MLNFGDLIFQLFALLVPIVFIVALVFFIRSSKKRKEQLDRIEEKLDPTYQKSSKK